jgi:predicted subunit of tRNA(5-methylaminomethyl-2-thiouridylate) methyltransferase
MERSQKNYLSPILGIGKNELRELVADVYVDVRDLELITDLNFSH